MWNVFKFFFLWFWLGVGSVVAWMVLAALTAPAVVTGSHGGAPVSGQTLGTIAGLICAFFMCIPAYFLARPKRNPSRVDSYAG